MGLGVDHPDAAARVDFEGALTGTYGDLRHVADIVGRQIFWRA
jgi:hypothetical protein